LQAGNLGLAHSNNAAERPSRATCHPGRSVRRHGEPGLRTAIVVGSSNLTSASLLLGLAVHPNHEYT